MGVPVTSNLFPQASSDEALIPQLTRARWTLVSGGMVNDFSSF
jgi:hypothetical protein